MKDSNWDEYKKSIKGLTKDQIEKLEMEAKKIDDELKLKAKNDK